MNWVKQKRQSAADPGSIREFSKAETAIMNIDHIALAKLVSCGNFAPKLVVEYGLVSTRSTSLGSIYHAHITHIHTIV